MKKLSTEQKAKAYDNAFNVALETYKTQPMYRDWLEKMFPELTASEDERIRKEIIAILQYKYEKYPNNPKYCNAPQWIAWLEKQGKKKYIWHDEDEEPQRGSLILLIMQSGNPIVAKITEPNHSFNHGEKWAYIDDLLEKQVEQKPQGKSALEAAQEEKVDNQNCLKPEPKFKVGQTIKKEGFNLGFTIVKIEDGFYYNNIGDHFPFTDQDSWELVGQEPAWSEEDETVLNNLIYALANDRIGNNRDEYVDWLKSLKPHSQWKPSDEQMKCLSDVVHKAKYKNDTSVGGYSAYMPLVNLYLDLKKLKGE